MGTSGGIVTGLESMSPAVREILATAEDASEMFDRIYRARKEENRKVSLQYLCRRAGIPSTGYLSDVLRGRRRLHLKYAKSLPAALGIEGVGARILRARLAL